MLGRFRDEPRDRRDGGREKKNGGSGFAVARRLPAAALALTVALAPSNTERQTVDSPKPAGPRHPAPRFHPRVLLALLPLLSRSSQHHRRAVSLRSLRVCPFSFSSLFTSVLVPLPAPLSTHNARTSQEEENTHTYAYTRCPARSIFVTIAIHARPFPASACTGRARLFSHARNRRQGKQ